MKCHCGCGQESGEKWFLEGHTNFTKEGIMKGIQTCKKNGLGAFFDPELKKEIGKLAHKRHPDLGKRIANIVAVKYSKEERVQWASKAGKSTHKKHPEHAVRIGKIGGKSGSKDGKFTRKEINRKAGKLGGKAVHKKHLNLAKLNGKKGYAVTIKRYPDFAKMGLKAARKKYPNLCSMGGKETQKRHPNLSLQNLKSLRIKQNHAFKGIYFASNAEKEVSKFFYSLGLVLEEGKTAHVRVGRKEFDWRIFGLERLGIKDGTFVEYHPWDFDLKGNGSVDKKVYYNERKEILEKNNFNDKLLVFTSIKDVKEVFKCKE